MSIAVMTTVWREFDGDAHTLLIALALADYADDLGGSIFPSVPTLAHKIRKDERTARRQLRALEQCGWLQVVRRSADGLTSNEYRIDPAWLAERGHRAPTSKSRGTSANRGHRAPPTGGTVPPNRGHLAQEPGAPVPPDPLRSVTEQEAAARDLRIRADDPEAAGPLRDRTLAALAELEIAATKANLGTKLPHEPLAAYRLRVLKHYHDQGLPPPVLTAGVPA